MFNVLLTQPNVGSWKKQIYQILPVTFFSKLAMSFVPIVCYFSCTTDCVEGAKLCPCPKRYKWWWNFSFAKTVASWNGTKLLWSRSCCWKKKQHVESSLQIQIHSIEGYIHFTSFLFISNRPAQMASLGGKLWCPVLLHTHLSYKTLFYPRNISFRAIS